MHGPFEYSAILRRQNWARHESKRPELTGQSDHIAACIRDPEIVIDTGDGCDHFYKMGFGTGKLANCYLHVLVRAFAIDDPGQRTVVSAWFTQVLEEGEMKWPRVT